MVAQQHEQERLEATQVVQQLAYFAQELPHLTDRRREEHEAALNDLRLKLKTSKMAQPLLADIEDALKLDRNASTKDQTYWDNHDGHANMLRTGLIPYDYDFEQRFAKEQSRLLAELVGLRQGRDAKIQEFLQAYHAIELQAR